MLARFCLPDLVAGVLFVILGGASTLLALDNELGTLRQTGPGFFPLAIGIFLIAIGLAVAAFSLRGPPRPLPPVAFRPLLVILGSPLMFAALMKPAGFAIAVFVSAAAGSFAAAGSSRWETIALAAALTAGSVLVFVQLLGQPLQVLGVWFD